MKKKLTEIKSKCFECGVETENEASVNLGSHYSNHYKEICVLSLCGHCMDHIIPVLITRKEPINRIGK